MWTKINKIRKITLYLKWIFKTFSYEALQAKLARMGPFVFLSWFFMSLFLIEKCLISPKKYYNNGRRCQYSFNFFLYALRYPENVSLFEILWWIDVFLIQLFFLNKLKWKRISRKQSAKWQHSSRLKPSAFFSLQKIDCYLEMQQHILGIGNTIKWIIDPIVELKNVFKYPNQTKISI